METKELTAWDRMLLIRNKNRPTAKDYIENMTKYVYPKLEKYRKSESFMNDGHTIVYESYLLEEPKATIIMIHGNCEKKEKYQEAIYYFLNME